MLRLAREGIPPSEFKQLSLGDVQRLRGLLSGEAAAHRHERGDYS